MPAPNTDSILVAFSAGKDSIVTLDLAVKRYKKVQCFFMYYVDHLSFNDEVIEWAEKRYKLSIIRTPHFELASLLKRGDMSHSDHDLKHRKPVDLYDLMRYETGIDWIATGEMKCESIERRAMIGALGPSSVRDGVCDPKRRIWFPLADWSKSASFNYMKRNRIPVPGIYKHLSRSFGYMRGSELSVIAREYPADYAKIRAVFPLAEVRRIQYEQEAAHEHETSEVQG